MGAFLPSLAQRRPPDVSCVALTPCSIHVRVRGEAGCLQSDTKGNFSVLLEDGFSKNDLWFLMVIEPHWQLPD